MKDAITYGISGILVDSNDVRSQGKDEHFPAKAFAAVVKAFTLLLRDLAGQER